MQTFLLFDFDGVIVDTFKLSYETSRRFRPNLTAEEYRRFFHGNIYDRQPSDPEETDEKREADNKAFFEHYLQGVMDHTPVDGMKDALETLAKAHQMVVVSSTISAPIQQYLAKVGFTHYFSEVMGADVHRSKHEKIKMVFDRYHTDAAHCVFLTDTLGDMREAAMAGVESIGVTWGFLDEADLRQGNPFAIVRTPTELVQQVEKYFETV